MNIYLNAYAHAHELRCRLRIPAYGYSQRIREWSHAWYNTPCQQGLSDGLENCQ